MEMTARGAGRIISSTERAAAHFVKRMATVMSARSRARHFYPAVIAGPCSGRSHSNRAAHALIGSWGNQAPLRDWPMTERMRVAATFSDF